MTDPWYGAGPLVGSLDLAEAMVLDPCGSVAIVAILLLAIAGNLNIFPTLNVLSENVIASSNANICHFKSYLRCSLMGHLHNNTS